MIRLIRFLYQRKNLLLFLALEAGAYILIKNNSPFHSAAYFTGASAVSGTVHNTKHETKKYFELAEVNKQLINENRVLNKRLFNRTNVERIKLTDSTIYEVVGAEVVNNSYVHSLNYITINAGETQGVKPGMGVISATGVVGRVRAVNKNFSVVTSVLHSKVLTSVVVGKNQILATMNWDGVSAQYGKLDFVPIHVKISKGDSVYTSGYNAVFPRGILTAVVEEVSKTEDSPFLNVKVKFLSGFENLKFVYVIDNKLKSEQIDLEEQSIINK